MMHFENFLKISLQEVLKTSWRGLEDVFARRLEDVLKTLWKRLGKTSWIRLQNVLKTYWRCLEDVFCKTSWTGIKHVWKTFWQDVLKKSGTRLENILKTKINGSVMKTLNVLSQLILNSICQYDTQSVQHSQKQYF